MRSVWIIMFFICSVRSTCLPTICTWTVCTRKLYRFSLFVRGYTYVCRDIYYGRIFYINLKWSFFWGLTSDASCAVCADEQIHGCGIAINAFWWNQHYFADECSINLNRIYGDNKNQVFFKRFPFKIENQCCCFSLCVPKKKKVHGK